MKDTTLTRTVLVFAALAALAPALPAAEYHYSGTIASGAQYDLYPIPLAETDYVVADLVCGTPNTLDTVLSAFAPGVDPSDTVNSTYYNDDGGSVVCGGFHSSHLEFRAYHSGDWTFRVDGFGSAVGDYTLDIVTRYGGTQAIPTLDTLGLAALALALTGIAFAMIRRRRA
jgi:hypothetical protein